MSLADSTAFPFDSPLSTTGALRPFAYMSRMLSD